MASTISPFLTRLFRPFTSNTRMSPVTSENKVFPEGSQKATVAAGCFWGVEHMFRQAFDGHGLLDAKVGYIGGDSRNPSYRNVCSGRSGHAEALQMVFDPSRLSYRQLLEFFYKMHDPTTKDRQGPDTGSQYRSAIFFHDDEQESIARRVTEKVQREWWKRNVATEIIPAAGEWWDAETYHQLYLERNPGGYECPSQ
ncbi:MAG: Peptide-methionine (S)-S-oxide reductase [Peltula sp. TS41687]|nr:MAG: Peptide-methionine (S)-S-oxide reductase [Peltula sp. TS41687]